MGELGRKNFVFDKRVYQPTPGINPSQAVVGACYECNPFDALDGDTICTVCRDMVLVCHECRPRQVSVPLFAPPPPEEVLFY